MPASINVLEGLNEITYLGSVGGPFSTYRNSLCGIYAYAPQGTLVPPQVYDPTIYVYNPVLPISDLFNFESGKTYYVIAKNSFTLAFSGSDITQYTTYRIPGGVVQQGGSGPVVAASIFLIGFDSSISTQGVLISSILPNDLQAAGATYIETRRQTGGGSEVDYYYSLGVGQSIGELTRFYPGSSYAVYNFTTTPYTLSVNRANGAIYLITEDYRFIVTDTPGLSNIRV